MSNNANENQVEDQVMIEATEETTIPEVESNEVEMTEEDMLKNLQAKRMGTFKVDLSYSDATYLRNMLDKTAYKGPQQAYLLIISKLELSQVCEMLKNEPKDTRHPVELTSATIESVSFFMNQKEGVGVDSAQKLFAASMVLRPAISEINKLDQELTNLSNRLEIEKQK
jgi:hypothetical protein